MPLDQKRYSSVENGRDCFLLARVFAAAGGRSGTSFDYTTRLFSFLTKLLSFIHIYSHIDPLCLFRTHRENARSARHSCSMRSALSFAIARVPGIARYLSGPGKPLENLLVVALEQAVAAPLCTSRLADAGTYRRDPAMYFLARRRRKTPKLTRSRTYVRTRRPSTARRSESDQNRTKRKYWGFCERI